MFNDDFLFLYCLGAFYRLSLCTSGRPCLNFIFFLLTVILISTFIDLNMSSFRMNALFCSFFKKFASVFRVGLFIAFLFIF